MHPRTLRTKARRGSIPAVQVGKVGAFAPPRWIVGSAKLRQLTLRRGERQKTSRPNELAILYLTVSADTFKQSEKLCRRHVTNTEARTRRAEKGPASGVYRCGKKHQRKAVASAKFSWGVKKYPTESAVHAASRRSSVNYQQSLRTSEPAANDHQQALGALPSRGTASQSSVHTRLLHHLRQKLDWSTLGISHWNKSKPSRWSAGTSDRSSEWYSSEDKCVMSAWFSARRSWEFCGHNPISSGIPVGSGGKRGPAPACVSAPNVRVPLWSLSAEQVKMGLAGLEISGSASRVSRGCVRNTSRELGLCAGSTALSKHELQPATLVLLASRWAPEVHQNGSIGQACCRASKPETCLARLKSQSLYNQRSISSFLRKTERQQTTRSGVSAQEERFNLRQERLGIGRRGLAHFRHTVGTMLAEMAASAHNPRLLAAQQPSCHEQVPAGNIEDQTLAQDKLVDAIFADGSFAEDKPNPVSALGTVRGWTFRSALIVP